MLGYTRLKWDHGCRRNVRARSMRWLANGAIRIHYYKSAEWRIAVGLLTVNSIDTTAAALAEGEKYITWD